MVRSTPYSRNLSDASSVAKRILTYHPDKVDSICREYSTIARINPKFVDLLAAVRGFMIQGYSEKDILARC